ncbi:MAG TPA: cytidine deaminase [Steroidobacteraceae bacterium]|jgi:cytidine deaminase|nr:cytidine deaminase [Steroidobacteraceae bacterium]
MATDADSLIARARECLERSYAPYSRFHVAAAVIDDRGRVFTGVNVENISYGLSMCAERVAIFSAVAAGARSITALAVASSGADLLSPCGACRQVVAEFAAPDVPVYCEAAGKPQRWTVAELLPNAFAAAQLEKS